MSKVGGGGVRRRAKEARQYRFHLGDMKNRVNL